MSEREKRMLPVGIFLIFVALFVAEHFSSASNRGHVGYYCASGGVCYEPSVECLPARRLFGIQLSEPSCSPRRQLR